MVGIRGIKRLLLGRRPGRDSRDKVTSGEAQASRQRRRDSDARLGLGALAKLDRQQSWDVLEWVLPEEIKEHLDEGEIMRREGASIKMEQLLQPVFDKLCEKAST